jgi:signal transduction histidine kinase/CheY-like chemotaxis protein
MATVLVADDRPADRQYLVTLLGYFGHRLVEASNGEEALRLARAERPGLVISDMVMPVMDGPEFVSRLRGDVELASIPVILYSAMYSLRQAEAMARQLGAFGVLPKPSEPEVILKMVHAALGLPEATVPPAMKTQDDKGVAAIPHFPAQLPDLRAISDWLSAIVEMSLEMAVERDPERLLELLTHSARKLIGARYAAVGLLSEDRQAIRVFLSSGAGETPGSGDDGIGSAPFAPKLIEAPPSKSILGKLVEDQRILRLLKAPTEDLGLSVPFARGHSQLECLLGVPLGTPSGLAGWLLLGDKLGATEFSGEDARVISTLASHGVLAYEKVDERRKLNQEVQQRVADLETANQSLETFSYSVSHDLRAPLRSIEGFSRILADDYGPGLDAEGQRLLGVIGSNARKMASLLEDLLSFSRVSRSEMSKSALDMKSLAESVVRELRGAEPARQIAIAVQPMPPAQGDLPMLRQVYENLISNAWKFTRHKPDAAIEIGSYPNGERNVYFVKDNGAGFNMEYAQKLFGVFQRFHSDREFEGTGIGLALVRRIIQRHGGEVWGQGKVGEGATFCFTL